MRKSQLIEVWDEVYKKVELSEENNNKEEELYYTAQLNLMDYLIGVITNLEASSYANLDGKDNEGKFIPPREFVEIRRKVVYIPTKVKQPERQCNSFSNSYDHRWDDHPSWYTDNKYEQQLMIMKSIAKAKDW